ncbi:MAG: helicase-exonuclease AddAB subunit AddA [Planctomycetaceae bacterium]|nr:helicase-exonuclease AddAB subunit AddA [Planctomycetaceae bacterium]
MSKQNKQIKWTKAQRQAIETIGRTVLVTASAGTGKTAALSGRAVERIADAQDRAQADNLLVLTFTDAAAEEMRRRIADTLYERCRTQPSPALSRQLLLLDRANISTIHAFCKRTLTEFFYMTDLDPAFGILDADEQKLLKSETLEETLEAAWTDEEFAKRLAELFNGRRVGPGMGSFVDRIIPLSEFLDSLPSRNEFYARAALSEQEGTDGNRELKSAQKQIMLEQLAKCRSMLEHVLAIDAAYCKSEYAAQHIRTNILPAVEQCRVLTEKDRFDLCRVHLAGMDFGRMPAFKKDKWPPHCKELIKEPIDKVKKKLSGLLDLALVCESYEAQIAPRAALQSSVLTDLLGRFDCAYAAAKRRRNVLDFADLEHRMLALLKQHPEVAAGLRVRFEYIFIDEYQDINAVQQSIIEQVRRPDNLFVVGDIKQSIYGFRQSMPEIFLKQLQAAQAPGTSSKAPCRIDLQENFRCRAEIIDFVNALFGRVMTEGIADMNYDTRAALVSGLKYPPFAAESGPAEPVEVILLEDRQADEDGEEADSEGETCLPENQFCTSSSQRQAAWIGRRIRQLVGADTGRPQIEIYDKKLDTTRPLDYRDIVILMRSLSHKARDYVEMLRLAGIPVSSQSSCGYFDAAEVTDCLCLLKVLDNPDRDIELAGLLRSPVFSVSDNELALVRLHAEENSKSKIRNSNDRNIKRITRANFYQAVKMYAQNGPAPALRAKLLDILNQIAQWRSEARNGSLADLLDRVLADKGLLAFYGALPNGTQRKANLLKLHDHAIQFEHFRTTDPGGSLGRFVEFLEKLDEGGQDWAPAEPDSAGENAVRIMSVHKAKGLEFPVVFAAELNTKFNMQDCGGECLISDRMLGLQILDRQASRRYPSMAHQVIADQRRRMNIAEEMRILYVALTRAREKLILTGSVRQSACVNRLQQVTALPQTPEWVTADGQCHLDWVLNGLAQSPTLHRLYETGLEGQAGQLLKFHAERVSRQELESISSRILQTNRSLKNMVKPAGKSAVNKAAVAFEHIRHNLQWSYPFEHALSINAKFSVSELVHREGLSAAVFETKPSAVNAAAGRRQAQATAMEVGSAFHALFESLDLSRPIDAPAIEAVLKRLVDSGRVSQAAARQVEIASALSFFEHRLGQLTLRHAAGALREWPFTVALNAQFAAAAADGDTVILQGIVDLIVPTSEGLIVVDFKTDRVTEPELTARSQGYAEQLRYYAGAAAAILRKPIFQTWLYYLTPRQAYPVNS